MGVVVCFFLGFLLGFFVGFLNVVFNVAVWIVNIVGEPQHCCIFFKKSQFWDLQSNIFLEDLIFCCLICSY